MSASGSATTLTTILPAAIQGPVFGNDYSRSIQPVLTLLKQGVRRLPRLGCAIVDVRDLVDLHIRAMEDPKAAGQRFISTGGYLAMADIATILRESMGARAAGVPTREASDFVFRMTALLNAEARHMCRELGPRRDYRTTRAEVLLGWRPREVTQTVVDTASSLIAHGLA
jgi:dihydroflavonol-4-reductase